MALGYYKFIVTADDDRMTLRGFLRRKCGLSARSMTVIKYSGGSITCDGKELRAKDILHQGDVVCVQLPKEECGIEPIEGDLDILYEDDYLLIVNKPPYMPVHPTKVHQLDTLANNVSFHQQRRGESYTFRALNRLDKDTSGCVVIAKDRIIYALVFPTIKKEYIAVCEGNITEKGTVDAPLAAAPDSYIERCVSEDGVNAITHYEPIRTGNCHTLCKLRLETGRTHQIRCHMSYIGHPLAGDDLYGGSLEHIQRQALHCQSITFYHPIKDVMISLTTPMPEKFMKIL